MMTEGPLLAIVDDDLSVRESLRDLLGELGMTVRVYESAEEFLSGGCIAESRCLILDIAMSGLSGPELH